MKEYADYNGSAHKALSDNRDDYIRQSAMTKNGRVPTMDEVREQFDRMFSRQEGEGE